MRVGSLSTGRFWLLYLCLMYSQAPVRSYTKDRAGLRWDCAPERGEVIRLLGTEIPHAGTYTGHYGL